MAEFDSIDANVKLGEFVGRAKEGVSKGRGELERFRIELVPKFVSWNWWERWKLGSSIARLIKLQEFLRLIVRMQRMLFTKQLSSKGTSY
nr:atp-dependent zinc metalloprotease ftsh 12, chloroplastic [Quercus suber]